MVGTRGVPARYGGFETAIDEVGSRLVERGHHVTVYCRSTVASGPQSYRGMELVVLPALRRKSLETLSHTALSALDTLRRLRFDVVFLFNAANAPLLPVLRGRSTAVAVHVDGLESRRAKWGRIGRRYYRSCEALSVRWADALIADAAAIGDYYATEFGASTELIAYGAPILLDLDLGGVADLGLDPGRYHLVVARFEPENHVDVIVEGYRRSAATWPLVVVGGAPYSKGHIADVYAAAADDPRIRFTGPIWDQELLDRLYYHAGTYLHGHSVGGTNPSLLRAMGAGTAVVAFDVVFAREVLADAGLYFSDAAALGSLLERLEADPAELARLGDAGRERAATHYRWDDVAAAYEQLALRLAAGHSRRKEVSGRRDRGSPWALPPSRRGRTGRSALSGPPKPRADRVP